MSYSVCDIQNQRIFEISEQQWTKNCHEKNILLRYLAIPLKEDHETLWLAIDKENYLNGCDIFAFIAHKLI